MTATPDQEAADPQQIIAGLRRQLAECRAELEVREREALEQQTATAEVLQVINESRGDLKPVFDAILEKAVQFCGPACGALSTFDGEYYHVVSMWDYPPEYAAFLRQPWRSTPGGLSERILQGGEFLHVADIAADENRLSGSTNLRALCELGGARTALWIGLRNDRALIGLFTLYRQEVRPFTNKEIALVRSFAAQAVIALENARLLEELRTRTGDLQQSLEYQTATSEVLNVISHTTFDLQPVFDTIVATAARLCDSSYANITIRVGDVFHGVAEIGLRPGEPAMSDRVFSLNRETVTGRVALAKQVVQVADIAADPEYVLTEDARRSGVGTVLGVPLMRDDVVVGTLNLGRRMVQPFTDRQIELVRTFADQAVIAMQNARLLGELRQRTDDLQQALEYQTATSDVLKVISQATFDIQPVFDTIVATAARLCEAGAANIANRDGDGYRIVAAFSGSSHYGGEIGRIMPVNRASVSGRAVLTGQVVQVENIATDPDYAITDESRRLKLGTIMSVPLLRDGTVIGTINLGRSGVRPYATAQIELVRTFADQAVIAIESARLMTEQREALEQQTATAEVLQVINASPGNLAPVFEAILEKAHKLCGVTSGALLTVDGDMVQAVATSGYSAELDAFVRAPMPLAPRNKLAKERGERVLHIADITADEVTMGSDVGRSVVAMSGARTFLWVFLWKDDVMVGMITAFRKEVRPFSDGEIALLRSFGAQAEIAMENARLLTETREALEQQTATAEVLGVINANPGDLTPVFDAILQKAHALCGASVGALGTYDGTRLLAVATQGYPAAVATLLREGFVPSRFHAPLLRGERLHVPDTQSYPWDVATESQRTYFEQSGLRTMLMVPLRKDTEVVGFISAASYAMRPFPEKEIALLENFAAQAVIAMENARLINETREALEQQTATAEVLQVINESPGNLTPVFDAMLEKAMRLCEAAFGIFITYDGQQFQAATMRGVPAAFAEFRRTTSPTVSGPSSPFGRLLALKQPVHVLDWMDDETYKQGTPSDRALADLGGARTVLFVPLLKDGAVLGIISIYRQEIRAFAEQQIALLENFAAQAVIAMENARLISEQREALEQQTATAEVLQVINASPGDLAPVFEVILEKALRLAEAAFGTLWTYDEAGQHVGATHGIPDALAAFRAGVDSRRISPAVRRVIETRSVLHQLDIREEEGYRSGHPGPRAVADLGGARTLLIVPLVKDRTVRGTIQIYRQEVRAFSDKQIALLENFAAQAIIAMDNARLIEEIRTARDHAEAALRDLKIAQANLVQAEKMASLGQLTAGIAHEIKNPLNFVNNFASLSVDLLEELKETAAPGFATLTEDQRADIDDVSALLTSNLQKITEHGKRADGIVKAMLEHSRGSAAERREVDLNVLVDEALNLAYHGARAQDQDFNITLERDFASGIAPIELNPRDMTRVFLNIFTNGFYAANKRAKDGAEPGFVPVLKVSTRAVGDTVEIHIRDNGTGIPPDIRDKLFQPFFTTKPTGEGTGLGLSITYDIVTKQHGGTIAVESSVNDHTTFSVGLPRHMFAAVDVVS